MYKPLSDSTLMSMTKREIIELLRIAEHDAEAMRETLNQQARNCQKLLAEARKHGHWKFVANIVPYHLCSVCGSRALFDENSCDTIMSNYCPYCGAVMDEEVSDGR